jgi:hypothetical protein
VCGLAAGLNVGTTTLSHCFHVRHLVAWVAESSASLGRGLGTHVDGSDARAVTLEAVFSSSWGVVFSLLGRIVFRSCGARPRGRRVALCYIDFRLVFLMNRLIPFFKMKM